MIALINTFLAPLTRGINRFRPILGNILLVLAIIAIPLMFSREWTLWAGEQALNLLCFILFLPVFARVLGIELAQSLMPLRKELGILTGVLAMVHVLSYIIPNPTFVLESSFWISNNGLPSFRMYGAFALFIIVLMTLTSNRWAVNWLGKQWKRLHRFVYAAILLVVIHATMRNWNTGENDIISIILLAVYFFGKIWDWQ